MQHSGQGRPDVVLSLIAAPHPTPTAPSTPHTQVQTSHKQSPHQHTSSSLSKLPPPAPPPNLHRYFVLTGTVLRYYRSERDAALIPRGVVDVQVSGRPLAGQWKGTSAHMWPHPMHDSSTAVLQGGIMTAAVLQQVGSTAAVLQDRDVSSTAAVPPDRVLAAAVLQDRQQRCSVVQQECPAVAHIRAMIAAVLLYLLVPELHCPVLWGGVLSCCIVLCCCVHLCVTDSSCCARCAAALHCTVLCCTALHCAVVCCAVVALQGCGVEPEQHRAVLYVCVSMTLPAVLVVLCCAVVVSQGCRVEPEEQGGSRQWRWRITEPGGNLLLRLGTGMFGWGL
jgi:hypothetical protein